MPHPDGRPKGFDEYLEWFRTHQEFQILLDPVNRSPGDIEYVAAYYEDIAARKDADDDPENEALDLYADVAYGEAYWWGEVFRTNRHKAYI